MNYFKKHILVFAIGGVLALSGCATLNNLFNNPVFVAGLQDAIEIAIGVIGAKYGASEMATIATVAQELAAIASNSTVSMTQLVTEADALIAKQGLNVDITAALDSLVVLAAAGLETGANAAANSNPRAVVNLTAFFNDIAAAAQNLNKASAHAHVALKS